MSFQLGLVVGMLSAAVCAYAAHTQQFWLLVASTMVAGFYNANASLYRFAAAELALPAFKEKAVSLVMAGGLLGAVLGPNLAQWTKSIFAVPFVGAYTALVFIALLSMLVISRIQFPELPKDQKSSHGRLGTTLGRNCEATNLHRCCVSQFIRVWRNEFVNGRNTAGDAKLWLVFF